MSSKRNLVLLLSLIICLGSYSQSKLINAGKTGKVSGTVKTETAKSKTSTKKSVTNSTNADNKLVQLDIIDISFANTDNNANIINDYGADLYAGDIKYLKGKVYYKSLSTAVKDITLFVKILKEDGSVMVGNNSPEGYTFKNDIKIEPGFNKSFELLGYGNNFTTSYSPGQYKYEIWYNGSIIYQKKLRLFSGMTPVVNHKLVKINSVKFANVDISGNIINNYDSILLENEVQYLKPQISYEGLSLNDQNVVLMVRLILPDGNIAKGTNSPLGFTYKTDFQIKSGTNTSTLIGWGNETNNLYPKGLYKYEIWLDGCKIYETSLSINSKNDSLYLKEENKKTGSQITSQENDDEHSAFLSAEEQNFVSKNTTYPKITSNNISQNHQTYKKHRFAIDLGAGLSYIDIGDYDAYDMFLANATLRYIYSFNKNIGIETDLSVMSDFAETTEFFISAGPRFSTNPSRKNLSLYFVPKIGYGQIEDYGAGGLSYEMELGLNFGRNLFVSYSYTGESTYIDYYRFEEDFNFSAHSIRFGIYF